MRHGKKVNHLSRTASHRKAMLANMASSLVKHKRITTTVAKAKALRVYLEPMVTKAKVNSTHNRRVVFSYLKDKEAIKELFDVISAKVQDRPGGYLRIVKLPFRPSDGAEMAMVEFVDFNEIYSNAKEGKADKSKTRRSRKRKSGGSAAKEVAPVAEAPVVEEAPAEKEAPVAEEAPVTEEATAEEEASEEAPAEKEAPVAEEAPATEEATAEEEASEEAPAEEAPAAEEASEEAPAAEEASEEAPEEDKE